MLYSSSLLVTHSKCSSVYMSSQTPYPFLLSFPLATKSSFSKSYSHILKQNSDEIWRDSILPITCDYLYCSHPDPSHQHLSFVLKQPPSWPPCLYPAPLQLIPKNTIKVPLLKPKTIRSLLSSKVCSDSSPQREPKVILGLPIPTWLLSGLTLLLLSPLSR